MLKVDFHGREEVEDRLLKYAVIAAKIKKKWIFCRHKERNTYEIPGGHREAGEKIEDTAKRELYEETGAVFFELIPVSVYSVLEGEEISYGMLFIADVKELGALPEDMEMDEIIICDTPPEKLTYPLIQLCLYKKVIAFLEEKEVNL